jgi:hypothetical protein
MREFAIAIRYTLINIYFILGGINEFKRGYQPRYNLVKDENGDLLSADRNTYG